MSWRHRIGVTAIILLAACQPGRGGPFHFVPTRDVVVYPAEQGPTARVTFPTVVVDVTGSWHTVSGQNIIIVYHNITKADIAISPSRFRLSRGGEPLELGSIVDDTDRDPTKEPGPPIFNSLTTPMARTVVIPADSWRRFDLSFDGPRANDVDAGQGFEFVMALPSGTATLRLKSAEYGD